MQDWIKHDGSECPVPKGTLVDVKHRDGEEFKAREAGRDAATDWSHDGFDGDIMFYRLSSPITLAPGDYVSTKGMNEDTYHAVAKAFMAAGAEAGEYPNYGYADETISCDRWSFGNRGGALWHGINGCFKGRHLTPAQVTGATNAGTKQDDPDTLTATLQYARDELAKAERCEAQAAEHRANHDGAMEQVRDMLPEGWKLVRDAEPAADMDDPANWQEGDVLVCIKDDWFTCEEFTIGRTYRARGGLREGGFVVAVDDDGDAMHVPADHFRFHHRP